LHGIATKSAATREACRYKNNSIAKQEGKY